MRRRMAPLRDFLNRESTSGVLILLASALGLITANSPLSDNYFSTLDFRISLGADWYLIDLSILKVINYLLMSIFFFVVGLEIKRELTTGHLASFKKALLPFVAALGGMAVPALIYLAIAGGVAPGGWGVPVATDIALAVGLLTMIGPTVAASLRSFLLALAVIDDIGAILVIAFVYSTGINFSWLAAAFLSIAFIAALKKGGVESTLVYSLFAFTLWFSLYKTGVHPTLAGVILGLMTPNIVRKRTKVEDVDDGSVSVIEWLEHKFHPISTFLVVPVLHSQTPGCHNHGINQGCITVARCMGNLLRIGYWKACGCSLSLNLCQAFKACRFSRRSIKLFNPCNRKCCWYRIHSSDFYCKFSL
jgi:Na+:H+ antiporter, NhaA family